MSSEKVPCPVDGCGKEFDTMELTAAHMKKDHNQEFGVPELVVPPSPPPGSQAEALEVPKSLGVVPPEVMTYLNSLMDQKVQAALEAERPQTVKAVGEAIAAVIAEYQRQGLVPGLAGAPGAKGPGGPGSKVTDLGGAIIAYITKPETGGDLTAFIKQAQQFKAIGELFNPPPGLADRIITSAYIKNLKKLDLVTDKAAEALDKELFPTGDP